VDGKARVASAERVTRDIHHLVLEIAEPSEFDYTPGQYLDLHIPNTDLRRSFSMACLPNSGKVEFLIKEYSDGAFSSLLAGGALAPGTPIDFSGPYGSFNLTRSDRDVLMVAGGSGMAPVLALLRELADAGSDRKIRFFYGARTSDDLFYQDVMVELGERLTDFAYAEVLSEPGDDWSGPTGFVHEIAAQVFADGELSDPEVYTCGPPPMIDALIGKLTSAHGVEEGDIRYDKFTTSVSE
jgi:propane monooxygenase reductase subunit